MSNYWSEEAIEALKELIVNPDLSYEKIGNDPRINKPRGAVCGKVNRLKIGRAAAQPPRRARRPVRPVPIRPMIPSMAQTGDFKSIMQAHAAVAAERSLIALVDLGESDCHFVYGDPRESAEVYCGAPAAPGLRYCRACAAKLYETIEVKRVATGRQHQEAERARVDA